MLRLLIFACALSAHFTSVEPNCGKPAIPPEGISTNIVGGQPAKENSWPWMVEVLKSGGHYCGGTLISDEWVVSAAHCFEKKPNLSNYEFSLGGHNVEDLKEITRQTLNAIKIIRHADYHPISTINDIALIKLGGKATFNDYVSPACLPSKRPTTDQMAYVTGWGDQEKPLNYDKKLQQVAVPIVGELACRNAYGNDIKDGMFCAGYPEGGKDSCQGDSGGPLVVTEGNAAGTWYLTGVVSWGYGCADPGKYGVYTDVYEFNEWISNTIAAN